VVSIAKALPLSPSIIQSFFFLPIFFKSLKKNLLPTSSVHENDKKKFFMCSLYFFPTAPLFFIAQKKEGLFRVSMLCHRRCHLGFQEFRV